MLYPCICNVVKSCWKSGAYDFVICRGGTDMCFVPGSGWKHLDLEQYRISGLTEGTAMLTMLQRNEGLKSNGQYAKVSRPKSNCIYYESSTLRYLSRTSRWYKVANPTQSVNSKQQTTALKELCVK